MRLKSLNIIRVASNLGLGVSGIIIGMLNVQKFYLLFYFSSAILLFSALYFQFFLEDSKQLSITQSSQTDIERKKNNKILFLILSCLFLVGLLISQLNIAYPLYIQQTFSKIGTQAVSILFILDTLLIVFFQAPLVNRLKNFNKIILIEMGAFLMGFGMFILNFSSFFSVQLFHA